MPGNQNLLARITARSDVFSGKPIIRDLRVSVELALGLLAQGVAREEILDDETTGYRNAASQLHSHRRAGRRLARSGDCSHPLTAKAQQRCQNLPAVTTQVEPDAG